MSGARWFQAAVVIAVVCSSWLGLRAWDEGPERDAATNPAADASKNPSDRPRTATDRQALIEEWMARKREAAWNTAAMQRILLRKARVDADDLPLPDLLRQLAKEHGFQIVIDEESLKDEGVVPDQPINLRVADVTLKSALNLILEPLLLKTVIRDEVLTVTTAVKAGDLLETRVYDVRKLLGHEDFTPLIEAITACIQPDTWDEVGGAGSIRENNLARAVAVRQTQEVHEETARLLEELERQVNVPAEAPPPAPAADPIRDAEQAIRRKLLANCDAIFRDQPVEQILTRLAETHQLPLWPDRQALADEGVSYDQKVTVDLHDVRLESVLNHVLRPLNLTWMVEDEVLKVLTVTKASDRLVTRAYPVRDLVAQPPRELVWPPADEPAPVFGVGMGIGGLRGSSGPATILRQGFGGAVVGGAIGGPCIESPRKRISSEGLDFTELIEVLTSTVEADSWDEVGGAGSAREFRNVLVVRQTRALHEEIEALLRNLRLVVQNAEPAADHPKPQDHDEPTLFVYHFEKYSYSPAELAKLIPEVVAPESWKTAGGKGTIVVQPSSLVVRQTRAVHKEIVKLLYDVVLNRK